MLAELSNWRTSQFALGVRSLFGLKRLALGELMASVLPALVQRRLEDLGGRPELDQF